MNRNETDILVAGESREGADFLASTLRRQNPSSNVEIACDGEDALDFVFCRHAHADRPSERSLKLILLDADLPKVCGLEALKIVKADPRTRSIPAVILTPSDKAQLTMDAYQLGANACLPKSPDPEQFAESVGAAGAYWIGVNRPASIPRHVRGAGQQ